VGNPHLAGIATWLGSPAAACALSYAAIFLVLGLELPYLPVWLDGRGFSAVEIGLIIGGPLWVRIVAGPLIGVAADRFAANRALIIVLALVATAAALALGGVRDLVLVMALVAVVLVASQSSLPLIDMLAIETARRDRRDYGRMRLWGSVAFIVANLAGGAAIARAGSEAVIWLIAGASALAALAALRLPRRDAQNAVVTTAASPKPGLDRGAVVGLLTDRRFLLLIVAAGAVQASHAVYYGFSVLAWQRLGWSSGWIGVLWATGVAAEIVLFSVSGRVVAAVGAGRLLALGALGGVLRWTAMAAEPGPWPTALLQLLHAVSFGATYLATVHLIQAIAPPGRGATAQALNSALGSGLAMALALIGAGLMYRTHGAGAYLAMAALAGVGLLAAVGLGRRWGR